MVAVEVILGLAILVGGAELLVRGASRLAEAVGLSPLVIGLTVVAFGTSSPELAVSIQSSLAGQADIALGNVVGSNIFNVLFILGMSALIAPLAVSSQLVRLDVPIMIAVSLLTWICAADGSISRWEGIFGVLGIIVYTGLLIRLGKNPNSGFINATQPAPERQSSGNKLVASTLRVLIGLALLVLGARWLVHGAIGIAQWLGVSELVIGLTIVAAGTSLPEAATSIVAALRKERDIAVGNIVGSNIFNLLAVLGASATVSGKITVAPAALHFDMPIMTAIAVICLPVFFTGGRISRWEGLLFLAYFIAYIAYLIMKSSHHEALPVLSGMMLWFVLPATLLGVGLSLIYAIRKPSH